MSKAFKYSLILAAAGAVLSIPAFAGNAQPPQGVPEPATLALLAAGVGATAVLRRIKKR